MKHSGFDFKGSFVLNTKLIETYEHRKNNVKVTLIPIPGETVAINVVNKFGSASECVKAKTGSLHLLEHLYFRIGKLDKSIDKSAFKLSVNTGAYQNAQTTSSSMELIAHGHVRDQEEIFKLFSERMADNYIDANCKIAEEQAVFNEAERSLKSPYMQVITQMSKIAMDGGSGYGWMTIGSIEDVANVTAQELMDLKAYFSKPENTHIVASGAVSTDTLKHIDTHFGSMPKSNSPIERPGLKPADTQVSMRQASVLVDAQFPVIALGFHSPKRQPFEFTHDDIMLRIIEKAIEKPQVQMKLQGFVNTSVFNPEYCAPYLFSFLSCPQTDPGAFPQAIAGALDTIKAMPVSDIKAIVKDLQYTLNDSVTSAHAATEMMADAVSVMKWDTVKSIHQTYSNIIKGNSIKGDLANFIDSFFDMAQSTFVVGVPKERVAQVEAQRRVPKTLEAPALKSVPQLGKPNITADVRVVDKGHNFAVIQKSMPDVLVNVSIPFQPDAQLKQEATHTVLSNMLNAVPLPPTAATSTRRSFSVGHDVFHISMKMKYPSGIGEVINQWKKPDTSMFQNTRYTAASMARGEQMNAQSLAKVAAINSIFKQSPFTNYANMPNILQATTLNDVMTAHETILNNLSHASYTFTGDWSEQDLEQYKAMARGHLSADFEPLEGAAMLKATGETGRIVGYNNTGIYTLNINGRVRTVEAHQVTHIDAIPQFQWVPKAPQKGWQHKELSNIATATIMYAVSFPREQKKAMEFAMNMFGDSMSGWTMQRVRWENCEQCYGINGQTVSTNVNSPPIAVLVGTVGAEALERAKVDVQQVIDEHAGHITQKQLDTAFARMKGEMTVSQDYAERIHANVHADLVSGNVPTLEITKPSLKEVNAASMLLKNMAKVEIVPTEAPAAPIVGAKMTAQAAAARDAAVADFQDVYYASEDECDSDIEFYL